VTGDIEEPVVPASLFDIMRDRLHRPAVTDKGGDVNDR
jgi:hypothetical protein